MPSPTALYATAVLLTLVALSCTALCICWSIPVLRQRLGTTSIRLLSQKPETAELNGPLAHLGTGVISIALAASAMVAWYGVYFSLTAI